MKLPSIFTCCCATVKQQTASISYLTDARWNNTVPFVPPVTSGMVIKVYDGDTITIASKLPYDESPVYRFSVRLAGIDCPEIKGPTTVEKELAKKARDALSSLVIGKIVYLTNVGTEKYGRLLADVYYDNLHINQWMLDNKYGYPYDGGTKAGNLRFPAPLPS
jgi:endonuclease YncB( thermonuclease family)